MTTEYHLKKAHLGYVEVHPKPSLEVLEEHYQKKYFQQGLGSYSLDYTAAELEYFTNQARICDATINRYFHCGTSLLDIGCGEGFFSSYFHKHGWDVSCIDFSEAGLTRQNPHLLPFFRRGDIIQSLDQFAENASEYGLLNLDNVLEHVLDPIQLLESMVRLMGTESLARIDVPNDFSAFQNLLTTSGCTDETWVAPPEHLSYFNKTSLVNVVESVGLEVVSLQADYPIEQFLLNENSNYWKNRDLGKAAHYTRVACSNYLVEQNIDRLIDYSEAAADLEFGRTLTAYVRLKKGSA